MTLSSFSITNFWLLIATKFEGDKANLSNQGAEVKSEKWGQRKKEEKFIK
jgi:hypothetical protein